LRLTFFALRQRTMTVLTKFQDEKKENEVNAKKAAVLEDGVTTTWIPAPPPPPTTLMDVSGADLYAHLRRRRVLTSFCFTLLLLWLLMAAFVGGVLFYRHLHRRPTFYGWCGTNYLDDGRTERLEQRVEVDPNQLYERIDVPKFGVNRPAVFVHDFRQNLTAIVDVLADRCFIKPLDRSLVAPPTSFIDLVEKMENGYYEQSPRVIREKYRVSQALDARQVDELGSFMITRQCADRASFMLQKTTHAFERPLSIDVDRFDRRFARQRRGTHMALKFSSMAGNDVEVDEIEM
jgi:hypothetical protein